MSIEVTDELVHHVARLSRLALSGAEALEIQKHFRKVLAYVSQLEALDTEHVDPSHFALEDINVHREDEPKQSLPVDQVLRNAPQATRPYFVVPRILGDGASHGSPGSLSDRGPDGVSESGPDSLFDRGPDGVSEGCPEQASPSREEGQEGRRRPAKGDGGEGAP